ncbi:hypothetical protein D3C85_704220 [compost metagenome]
MQVGLGVPDRTPLANHREQDRVFQAGEFVFIGRGRPAHAHVAETAVGVTGVQRRLGTVADGLVVELEFVLGLAVTFEIVPDQDRHRVADEHRYLAGRQQRIGGVFFREYDPVLVQVLGGDDAVRLQFGAQQRQVETLVDAVGTNGLEQHRVALLLRPARHVLGADVAGKYLAAAHLGQ